MSMLRPNQRPLTALSPHNANRTHLMPNFSKDFRDGSPVAGEPPVVGPAAQLTFTFAYRMTGPNVDDIVIKVITDGGVGPQTTWSPVAETEAFWDFDRIRGLLEDPVNITNISREEGNTLLVFDVPNGFFQTGDDCRIDKNTDTPSVDASEITAVLVGLVP